MRLARFALYFAFAGVLVVLSFIDLATRRLPDVITLPALPILFLAAFGAHDVPWLERLIGAAAGYLVFRLIGDFWYYVLKREGLGLGDGKLLAVIGAVLGWRALPFVVFGGSIVGTAIMLPFAIVARRRAGHSQERPQDSHPKTRRSARSRSPSDPSSPRRPSSICSRATRSIATYFRSDERASVGTPPSVGRIPVGHERRQAQRGPTLAIERLSIEELGEAGVVGQLPGLLSHRELR